MDNINLNRTVFDKNSFNNTVNTNFNQLTSSLDPTFFDLNLATVDDFFILYNKFFYDIPKFGNVNSHEYIINQSSDYINYSKNSEDIQILLDEIASLRQEILDIQLSTIAESSSESVSTNTSNKINELLNKVSNLTVQKNTLTK